MCGQDLVWGSGPCIACAGKGRNPKNRKHKCESCDGHGKQVLCGNCLKPWRCDGMRPNVMDGQCENPRVIR